MEKNIGIWIDRARALVVVLSGQDVEMGLVISRVEKRSRRRATSSGEGAIGARVLPEGAARPRTRGAAPHIFLDTIIGSLRGAKSIFIIGPGEGGGELRRRIAETAPELAVVGMEAAGKMSNQEVATRTKEFYAGRLAEASV